MATGKSTQLTRQIGEHLIVSMLGRKGIIATPFAGNVPDFDILASDETGKVYPIQVKTIKGPMWQFSASTFLEIKHDKKYKTQNVIGKKTNCNQDIVFVLVKLGKEECPDDQFYVLSMAEMQKIIHDTYKGENRPNNWESTHCAIRSSQLTEYEGGWDRIDRFLKITIEE